MNSNYAVDPRYCGILFHPTSLPGPWGIGDLGSAAYRFADFLAEAKVSLWQILPLGPTGYGNSPYAARSSFAGNEYLISPDLLIREGWLEPAGGWQSGADSTFSDMPVSAANRIDYGKVEGEKLPLLHHAAENCLNCLGNNPSLAASFKAFCAEENFWLDDYAVFMVIYEHYRDSRWHTVWDKGLGARKSEALDKIRRDHAKRIQQWKMLQYFFFKQWNNLHDYVRSKGIKIIGDIPIFVAPDSVDAWANLEFFKTKSGGSYSTVSGVPPDYFSATGQLWGNPVYDWKKLKQTDYAWWKLRIKALLRQTDIFRIDHFRGFDAYWAIPAENTTAEHGVWEKGPGMEFFNSLRSEFGKLPIIAEDLGFLTESVIRLRDESGFPGMKVCQFGFEDMRDGILDSRHLFLPHNYPYHCAAYTGTHDNNTSAGWFNALGSADRKKVCEYFNCEGRDIAWAMIRAVTASHAEYAIFPMQDILGLGEDCRMNLPSTCRSENWSWRLSSIPAGGIAEKLASIITLYSRG
ncbi:MAG: 4-alpha-glucanotransferase [Treponema sp.]|jgi:4-alpha-glucanotransferase|nr:4-alpha-glucanotransferase [Treponema sp.]